MIRLTGVERDWYLTVPTVLCMKQVNSARLGRLLWCGDETLLHMAHIFQEGLYKLNETNIYKHMSYHHNGQTETVGCSVQILCSNYHCFHSWPKGWILHLFQPMFLVFEVLHINPSICRLGQRTSPQILEDLMGGNKRKQVSSREKLVEL